VSKTPSQVLDPITLDQFRQLMIGILQSRQDPITDWNPGAERLTQMQYSALGAHNLLTELFPALVGAPYFGFAPSSDWVDLVADQRFNTTRVRAVLTQQTLRIDSDGTHGPFVVDSSFVVTSPLTGNRYYAITGGTLTTGAPNFLLVTVQAEGPNDPSKGRLYADGPNSLTKLAVPWSGVTATNAPPTFSAVTTTPVPALGLGVVTLTGTAPAVTTAYDVQVVRSGQNTTAQFRYRLNGGPWSATQNMAATFVIGTVTVHFTNDAGGSNPSFRTGDVYSFTSPGSPIVRPGTPAETDAALVQRCYDLWNDTSAIVDDKRKTWAKKANAAVKRVALQPDLTYPGRVLVTIAGAPGTAPLGGGVIATVQTAIDQQEGICDLDLVAAATNVTVTATNATGGQVTVKSEKRADVQAAANLAWSAYGGDTDIGGTVRLAKLEQILVDAGVIDVTGLLLNGVAANVVLGVNDVAVVADLASLNWVEV
jgi:hypothetical protein